MNKLESPERYRNCPWCGAGAKTIHFNEKYRKWYADWGCQSSKHGDLPWQSNECRINCLEKENDELNDEIKKLKSNNE